MLTLVIFDADGVLFESDQANVAYYNAIFERMGEPPMAPEEARACVFLSGGQVFEMRAEGDPARVRRMHEIGTSLDFTPFFKLLRPPVELRPFLMGLKQRYRIGLATNRSATVPALIEYLNLEGVFDAVASARDNVPPKPAPDIIRLCLERAGVAAKAAVYVGDSDVDREAAEAAGTHFIAVGHRVNHHHRVPILEELPAKLESLFGRRDR
ncbi:MAG: HAD-IA family hydrolase [Candidatus Binataceae bacterium]